MDQSLLKEYFWISGRIGRLSYFGRLSVFVLSLYLFAYLYVFTNLVSTPIFLILFLIASWSILCSFNKRLHDLGHSGLWCLVLFVPILDVIGGLYLLFAAGYPGPNIYGFSPKALKELKSLNQ
jgi:uncharacterized membrane protein YhaH (DUF805 family)